MLSRSAALALAALALPTSSLAVVASSNSSTPTPVDTTYSYVGQVNGSSGVAVGPHTFLTAGHVGLGDFILSGTTYHATGSVAAPNGYDLLAVTVAETLPGYYSLGTTIATGATVTMVGYGKSGVVNAAGNGYDLSPSGTRHSGNNTLDFKQDEDGEGPSLLSYVFGAGDAAVGDKDSGGGWFSGGKLVGISLFTFNNTDPVYMDADPAKYADYGFASQNTSGFNSTTDAPHYTGPAYSFPAGEAYFGSGAINLTDSRLQPFLAQAVPEPSAFFALGLGALAMLRRKRR